MPGFSVSRTFGSHRGEVQHPQCQVCVVKVRAQTARKRPFRGSGAKMQQSVPLQLARGAIMSQSVPPKLQSEM